MSKLNHVILLHDKEQKTKMNTLADYKKQLESNNITIVKGDKISSIIPIKFEKVGDECHMFSMITGTVVQDVIKAKVPDSDIDKVLIDALNIVLPTSKNITIEYERDCLACVIDGQHLNVDMLNYLRKINNPDSLNLIWNDMDGEKNSIYMKEIKKMIQKLILKGYGL